MNYHEQENELHEKWEKRWSKRCNNKYYNKDGLVYMGIQKESDTSSRESGDEESLWEKASIKILFILKESYGNVCPQDLREWMAHKSNDRIYNNMCRIVYGIVNFDKNDYSYPDYESLDMVEVRKEVAMTPYGYINIKKISGNSTSSDKEIKDIFLQDSDYIEEQIKILNPNVMIFGGILSKSRKIKIKVMEMFNCYNEKADSWITTNNDKSIAIVDSYHLNPRSVISDKDFYTNFMESYKEYCKGNV